MRRGHLCLHTEYGGPSFSGKHVYEPTVRGQQYGTNSPFATPSTGPDASPGASRHLFKVHQAGQTMLKGFLTEAQASSEFLGHR